MAIPADPGPLQLVLADAEAIGGPIPAHVRTTAGENGMATVLLVSSDGTAHGFKYDYRDSFEARVADAADRFQEWAIEELQGTSRTNWPPCPQHPGSHPLEVTMRDGAAVWACPTSNLTIARVGELRLAERSDDLP